METSPPRADALLRTLALIAVAGAAAGHTAMLPAGGWMALLGGVMLVFCAPCAAAFLRAPGIGRARMLLAGSLMTALLHALLPLVTPRSSDHSHLDAVASGEGEVLALLVIAADLLAAALLAAWLRLASGGGAVSLAARV